MDLSVSKKGRLQERAHSFNTRTHAKSEDGTNTVAMRAQSMPAAKSDSSSVRPSSARPAHERGDGGNDDSLAMSNGGRLDGGMAVRVEHATQTYNPN